MVESGVTGVGTGLFSQLTEVTQVILSDTVETIGSCAFYNCNSLVSIVLGEAVKTINSNAFWACQSLTSITLPASVTSIGSYSFRSSGVTEIIFKGDPPSIHATYGFYGVTGIAYYPADNANWTDEVKKNYGGKITWMAWGSTDKEELAVLIAQAEELNEAVYTEKTWSTLQKALNYARETFADEDATQIVINDAVDTLEQAIRKLAYNDADKTELEAAIRETGELEEILYTPDSWAALQETLEAAEEIFNDLYASQTSVDAAAEALNAAIEDLVPHTHEFDAVVTEPTCTEGGFTTYTCRICGEVEVRDYEEPLGHTWTVLEVTEPTCTEGGFTEFICSVCGDTCVDDYKDATGHAWEDPEVIWSEDYSSAVAVRSCSACGETESADAVVTTETAADGENETTVHTATAVFEDGTTVTGTVTEESNTEDSATDTAGTGSTGSGSSGNEGTDSGSSDSGSSGYSSASGNSSSGSSSTGNSATGNSSSGNSSSGNSSTGNSASGNSSSGSSGGTAGSSYSTSPQTGDPGGTAVLWMIAGVFGLAGCAALALYRIRERKRIGTK